MKKSLFMVWSLMNLGLAPGIRVAQAQDALGPIDIDSPDFTVSTSTVPRGRFQTESRISALRRGNQHTYALGDSLVRYGISSRAEVRFGAPAYVLDRQGTTVKGLDDASIELKMRVKETKKSSFGVLLDTIIPTGTGFITEDTYQPGATLAAQFRVNEKLNFVANLSARRASTNLQKYTRLGATAELEYRASPKLGGYAEVYGFNHLQEGGDSQKFAALGVIYRVGTRTALDARLGSGIGNHVGGPQRFYGFGLSHLF